VVRIPPGAPMKKLLLTLDLVPSSCWYNNVRALLTQTQWNKIKSQVSDKAHNVCEICGGIGSKHPVECHEVWEYNEKTLIQKLVKLIALCPDCHSVKHFGLAQIQNKGRKALKHLMKINKITKKAAEKYIADSFMEWAERSGKNWKLDISYLEIYGIDTKKIKYEKEKV